MIKETIDAVRVAEIEAEQAISAAEEKAQTKKNQIKSEAQEHREESLKQAKENAQRAMSITVDKCNNYEKEISEEIDKKVVTLKLEVEGKIKNAVDEVINALV